MEGQGISIVSLVIVVVIALITPILLHRFKLNVIPVVVAEILMGLLIGKSGLNIVQEGMWLETLSSLGFIFLMFLSGLEIDFSVFTRKKKSGKKEPNTFYISALVFAGIFVVSIILAIFFNIIGLVDNIFLMTLIISTISLGVVVPTLKEANLMKTTIGQIILLIAVIADLVTMILLAVFASLYEGEGNTWLLLILFGAGMILYFIGRRYKSTKLIETLASGTTQIGTRAIFTLIIVLVAISETIGAEAILGAFLAGVLVSLLAPDQELIHKLDSFGYGFFIPIFFVMIGVDLNIWELLSDPKMIMFIPLLLIALLISKLLPAFILRKWFNMKTVVASGILLTSTLSLVIAAAAIGENLGVISEKTSGTLILVAIISCVITPVLFKKIFPQETIVEEPLKVAFIGANQLTLPISRELESPIYRTFIYHTKQEKAKLSLSDSLFEVIEIDDFSLESLEKTKIFHSDIIVVATGNDSVNAELAIGAKEKGVDRVIVRIESPDLVDSLRDQNIEVFSVYHATNALLQALIESPRVLNILTNKDSALHEIRLRNEYFDGMSVRHFPFTGDVIFVRIFRGKDSIVPHGDTELKLNDRIIVTGSKEYVEELRKEMEFSQGIY